MVNVVPCPADVETAIVPPSDVTTIARDAQAKAGAAAGGLGRDPRLEDARQHVAGSIPEPVSRTSILTRPSALSAASVSMPPVRHRVERVGHEVEERELELRFVGRHAPERLLRRAGRG